MGIPNAWAWTVGHTVVVVDVAAAGVGVVAVVAAGDGGVGVDVGVGVGKTRCTWVAFSLRYWATFVGTRPRASMWHCLLVDLKENYSSERARGT